MTTMTLDRYLTTDMTAMSVGAVGSAIAQRKLTDTRAQAEYRIAAMSTIKRSRDVDEHEIMERLDAYVLHMANSQRKSPAPEVVPPATQGRNVILVGAEGRGRAWTAGAGLQELARHTRSAVDEGQGGFTGFAGEHLVGTLDRIAAGILI